VPQISAKKPLPKHDQKKIIHYPLNIINYLLHLHQIKALGKRGGVYNASSFCLQEFDFIVLSREY
jgi:hypothetical protein